MANKIKIWIIEDEALIAHNLRLTLEDLGYAVLGQSYDYESGLESIDNQVFDLLLIDINLGNRDPEKNGLALAAALKKVKNVPFVFLTAYSDKDTITKAAALQPSGYIIKPTNAATLFATLQIAIENHATHQKATMPNEKSAIPDYFFSKIGLKIHKIYWRDVAKLESIKNYVSIKVFHTDSEYLIRGSLVQIVQSMIPLDLQMQFVRINRAVYLQHKAILSLNSESVMSPFGEIQSTGEMIRELKDLNE